VRYLHHHEHFELGPLQTAMFMQLVIAGHLLLFSTRASGFFFQPPFPEWKFFAAIMGTQVLAACMAAFDGSLPLSPGALSVSYGSTTLSGFS
jgi:H+-transporting ATPase